MTEMILFPQINSVCELVRHKLVAYGPREKIKETQKNKL